jgi:hypothetical protein
MADFCLPSGYLEISSATLASFSGGKDSSLSGVSKQL